VALKRTQKIGNIVSREYEVLCLLKGAPNVVQLLDFFYTTDQRERVIQNTVMEFCDWSLEEKLRQAEKTRQPLPMAHIKHYAYGILNGLMHMHKHDISHRDLKPENILLKIPDSFKRGEVSPTDVEVKICDLGSAKVLDNSGHINTPYVVSRYYRSPELIMGSHFYDCSIDVWAMGCILFELITRTPLFPADTEGVQLLEHAQMKGMPSA
jgi:serine/threonine protein kinase